ncbi:redoxin domain-containing protein [Virgibacillus sp. YIM 98842]|uniref:redoxin domain-containing protein n=1 Tax=Virgibacillus sp. YIM 98842 TaxID=2663533 RepID=UPI0013D97E65|nr:redoxin domain-containing protein [Virgibacillus sp. YIM 98842]
MKKWMIIIVLLGAVAWVISDFITNSNSDNSTSEEADSESEIEVGLDAGQLAPDFELQTVSGETVRLSDFRGEKVLY